MPVSRVGRGKLAALRTSKAFALLKKQQPPRFAFKSTFPHFPSRFELQAAVNNASGVIALILFPKARIYKGGNEALYSY